MTLASGALAAVSSPVAPMSSRLRRSSRRWRRAVTGAARGVIEQLERGSARHGGCVRELTALRGRDRPSHIWRP